MTLSTILRRLREAGDDEAADKVATLADLNGRNCPVHGYLADPLVFTATHEVASQLRALGVQQKNLPDHQVGDRVLVFACPDCSDPAARTLDEDEEPVQA